MKIKFKAAGVNISVECEEGTTCSQAVALFESLTSKTLSGMALYSDGKKITDLTSEAPQEIIAVTDKNASA